MGEHRRLGRCNKCAYTDGYIALDSHSFDHEMLMITTTRMTIIMSLFVFPLISQPFDTRGEMQPFRCALHFKQTLSWAQVRDLSQHFSHTLSSPRSHRIARQFLPLQWTTVSWDVLGSGRRFVQTPRNSTFHSLNAEVVLNASRAHIKSLSFA